MKYTKQAGFTLIEILVTLSIIAAIALGAAGAIKALYGTSHDSQAMQATNNIENAISWINRDVLQSQTVSANSTSTFLLNLKWEDWGEYQGTQYIDNRYQIIYSLNGNNLQRSLSLNGGAPTLSTVARNINVDPDLTNCLYTRGVLNLQITSNVGSADETRSYQLKIRTDTPQ
jgi:prepilin-type N-terminal cleavage/methylation domain-containing protein